MTQRTIETRTAELRIEDAGLDEPALVFLHYWGGSARTWDAVVSRLPADRRKIVINQRGWGGSRATDGCYDLEALSDDVVDVIEALGITRFVVVGHSMGGKVAQLLAGRRPRGLLGLLLVAPAPPTPMQVPPDARQAMLTSYQSREGMTQALQALAGSPLEDGQREQVIRDSLGGEDPAKRYWPDHGMMLDVSAALKGLDLPIQILMAELDRVEPRSVLEPIFAAHLPKATITTIPRVGHLMPLEAPEAIATSCERLIAMV